MRKFQNKRKGEGATALCVAGESLAFYEARREKQRNAHAVFLHGKYIPASG